MRYLFIVNPKAGKGRASQFAEKIKEYFKSYVHPYSVYMTSGPGSAFSAAKKEAEKGGELRIYACGGDGTLFETVGGAYGYENTEIGHIPFGWGNNFIRNFGTISDFQQLDGQIKGSSMPIDLIRCADKYAVNFCSVGMGSELKDNFLNQFSGRLNYNVPMMKDIAVNRTNQWKLFADGEEIDGSFMLVAAANGNYYGCGYKIAPDSYPADGYFSCILMKSASLIKTLSMVAAYKNGELYLDSSCCTVKDVRRLEIKTNSAVSVAIDGESFKMTDPAFEIVPKAVKFIVPSISLVKDPDAKQFRAKKKGASRPVLTDKL